MIYILLITFQFTDSVNLNYSYLIPGKFKYVGILEDNFSLAIDYEMDSAANIYVLDHQPNKLKRYSVKLTKTELIEAEQLTSYNRFITLFKDLIFIIGDSNQIINKHLKPLQNLHKPTTDHLLTVGNFVGKTRAFFKTSMSHRDFYTIDIDNNYQLQTDTKQEFPFEQQSYVSFTNGILIENKRLIQTFAKNYLIEIVDQNNQRTLYTRSYHRMKELMLHQRVVYTKDFGVVSNQFITNNMNGYYKGRFQDDIIDIMGSNNGYYYVQTARPDENRLDFDIVDFNRKSYRHFYLTFPDHVSSAKVRYGKLLVELRDRKQAKLVIYDIQNNSL